MSVLECAHELKFSIHCTSASDRYDYTGFMPSKTHVALPFHSHSAAEVSLWMCWWRQWSYWRRGWAGIYIRNEGVQRESYCAFIVNVWAKCWETKRTQMRNRTACITALQARSKLWFYKSAGRQSIAQTTFWNVFQASLNLLGIVNTENTFLVRQFKKCRFLLLFGAMENDKQVQP